MKKLIIVLFICAFAVCALAADRTVTVTSATTFNGKTLTPGDYKLTYDIKGNTADLKLMQAGKTVATATGQVVEQKVAVPYNAIVNETKADGTSTVVEIQFANQKNVIRLNADNTAVGK
jgi:alpha-L-arabinofuranosidase